MGGRGALSRERPFSRARDLSEQGQRLRPHARHYVEIRAHGMRRGEQPVGFGSGRIVIDSAIARRESGEVFIVQHKFTNIRGKRLWLIFVRNSRSLRLPRLKSQCIGGRRNTTILPRSLSARRICPIPTSSTGSARTSFRNVTGNTPNC